MRKVILALCALLPLFLFASCGPSGNKHHGNTPPQQKQENTPLNVKHQDNDCDNDCAHCSNQAEYYLGQDDLRKVEKMIGEGETIDPSNPKIQEIKGRLEYRKGNLKSAIKILEKVIKNNPDYAPAYNTMAMVYLEMDEPEKGLSYAEKAIKLSPTSIPFKTTHAKCMDDLDRDDESDQEFKKIVEEDPDNIDAYTQWAKHEYNLGNRMKSIEILEKAITKCKIKEELIHLYDAKIDSTIDMLDYIENDNDEEAKKTVAFVITSVEKDIADLKTRGCYSPVFYTSLTNMYQTVANHSPERGNEFYNKAKEYARKYINEAKPPEEPFAYHLKGEMHYVLGEHDEALKNYKKAMVGKYAYTVYINVAEVYIARKDYPTAREYLNKVIKLKRKHPDKKEAEILLKKIKAL